jgi:hypothetical protein
LAINYFPGVHVRVVNRQPTQQLGANGRDDGSVVSSFLLYLPILVFFLAFKVLAKIFRYMGGVHEERFEGLVYHQGASIR